MAKVIIDPTELRRFARSLHARSGELNSRKRNMEAAFRALNEFWKDKKYERFQQNFEYTSKLLDEFVKKADSYVSYLRKKADKVDIYLGQ